MGLLIDELDKDRYYNLGVLALFTFAVLVRFGLIPWPKLFTKPNPEIDILQQQLQQQQQQQQQLRQQLKQQQLQQQLQQQRQQQQQQRQQQQQQLQQLQLQQQLQQIKVLLSRSR